jgi:hypothetical protein
VKAKGLCFIQSNHVLTNHSSAAVASGLLGTKKVATFIHGLLSTLTYLSFPFPPPPPQPPPTDK